MLLIYPFVGIILRAKEPDFKIGTNQLEDGDVQPKKLVIDRPVCH
jgi:hypothetical protein